MPYAIPGGRSPQGQPFTPATLPTVVLRIVVQAQHIDTEFYETHFGKSAYLDTHARHLAQWHGQRRE